MAPSHYGPEKFQVTKCSDCGMIFTNPQPTTYIEEVANRGVLDRHFNPHVLERQRKVASFVLSAIAPLARGRRILDFGCGAGAFVAQALSERWDASGVDLNAGLVAQANRHWGIDTLVGAPLSDFVASAKEPYDAIVALQVFEHLQDPIALGRTLTGMLKEGGLLYIDVPNANQVGEWLNRGATLDPTAHWNHFTVSTLRELVRKSGCEVVAGTAAPSLVNVYHRVGLSAVANSLGRLTRAVLPGVGTGVCVIGRRPVAAARA